RDGAGWPQRRPSSRSTTGLLRLTRRRGGLLPFRGRVLPNPRRLLLRFRRELHIDARMGEGEIQTLVRARPHHGDLVLVVHGARPRTSTQRAARDRGREHSRKVLHVLEIENQALGGRLRDADVADVESGHGERILLSAILEDTVTPRDAQAGAGRHRPDRDPPRRFVLCGPCWDDREAKHGERDQPANEQTLYFHHCPPLVPARRYGGQARAPCRGAHERTMGLSARALGPSTYASSEMARRARFASASRDRSSEDRTRVP